MAAFQQSAELQMDRGSGGGATDPMQFRPMSFYGGGKDISTYMTYCPGDADARIDSFHMDIHLTLVWASIAA